tara:strand:+ start:25119 stop:25979 length:861 start_codon:yes stop_codon:yes gene_type:complete
VSTDKQSINQEAVSEQVKDHRDANRHHQDGTIGQLNCQLSLEDFLVYDQAECEVVLNGTADSRIILGRDRHVSKASGGGGQGDTHVAHIHMIAGQNQELKGNPNPQADSATIYLSQKTDIDKAFGTTEGVVGSSKDRSGIGMKADGVRIVANHGIKLVTLGFGEPNQFNEKAKSTTGVDIIAGNSEEGLEPMVKGYMLQDALEKITNKINDVSAIVNSHIMNQTLANAAMGFPPAAAIVVPVAAIRDVVQCIAPGYLHKINIGMEQVESLSPMGAGSFCSRHNNVN